MRYLDVHIRYVPCFSVFAMVLLGAIGKIINKLRSSGVDFTETIYEAKRGRFYLIDMSEEILLKWGRM
jgi:hypothetical protein